MKRLPDPRDRPWLKVAELAEITGEGEKAIRAAIDREQLPAIYVGRYVRIPTAKLLQMLGIEPENTEADSSTEPAAVQIPAVTTLQEVQQDGAPPPAA